MDPEPPAYKKALHQIRNTFSTSRLEAQGEYLRNHTGSYTQSETNALFSAIEKQMLALNPEPTEYNCARISEILVTYSKEGNGYFISPKSRTHNLAKYCELADQEGKRLTEYIIEQEEIGGGHVYDVRYEFQRPTATLKGMRIQEEEVAAEYRVEEEKPKGNEARIGIDVMDIINRLSRQIDERFEELQNQLQSGAKPIEIDTMRQRIDELEKQRDKLESEYKTLVTKTEREQRTKTYENVLTAKEYSIFQALYSEYLPGLRPYTYHKAGEGYTIRIEYETPEQEQAIVQLMQHTRTQGRPVKRTTPAIAYTPLVDTLCHKYESETGGKCGLSRTGALSGLAQMILEYVDTWNSNHPNARHELDLQSIQGYIDEMDLFASPGQGVYRAEQAQEAFSVLVKNVESSVTEMDIRTVTRAVERESDLCIPEVLYPDFIDIYVYLERKKLGKDTENDKKAYDRALKDLGPCGYTPEKYGKFLDEAVIFFSQVGQNFYAIVNEMIGR